MYVFLCVGLEMTVFMGSSFKKKGGNGMKHTNKEVIFEKHYF